VPLLAEAIESFSAGRKQLEGDLFGCGQRREQDGTLTVVHKHGATCASEAGIKDLTRTTYAAPWAAISA